MLTLEILRENYIYLFGDLYSRKTRRKLGSINQYKGKPYLRCKIGGRHYYIHRLIFWIVNGYLPNLVDHKDQNTLNNYQENLRDLSHSLNLLNGGLRADNKSGYRGVIWHKKAKKWVAKIRYQNKDTHLGLFDNIEDAVKARSIAENDIWNPETTLFAEA